MDREQMGLASASTSSAAPAVKRRGRVAALIAAVIVAAALLFAMPSLAFASSEEASSSGGGTQEILLSTSDSSKSVNKTPDEPKTPPAYTAQDAYKSTPGSNSGVDVVLGASDSTNKSYTPGDDKSSIGDKDSDSDSDNASNSSNSGTENKDDITQNTGNNTSSSNNDHDSTDSSNGAISDSGDEIATGNNQSAHPTVGDIVSDTIAAGDKNADHLSADPAASTTSAAVEEVHPATSSLQSTAVTPQAANEGFTLYLNKALDTDGLTTGDTSATKRAVFTTTSTPNKAFGTDLDPIFCGTGKAFLCLANQAIKVSGTINTSTTISIDDKASTTKLSALKATAGTTTKLQRYGATISSYWCVGFDTEENHYVYINVTDLSATSGMFAISYKASYYTGWEVYPVWQTNAFNIEYQNFDVNGNVKFDTTTVNWDSVVEWKECPATPNAIPSKYEYYSYGSTLGTKQKDSGKTTAIKKDETITLAQYLSGVFGIFGSTAAYNSSVWGAFAVRPYEIKEDLSYKVNYNAGTGTGSSKTETYDSTSAKAYKQTDVSFSKTGYTFTGWNTKSDGTGTAVAFDGVLTGVFGENTPANNGEYTLYAVWAVNEHKITYDGNKPTAATTNVASLPTPNPASANYGSTFTISTTKPTLTNYTFLGWSTNKSATTATYTDTNRTFTVNEDTTLYAVWSKNPVVTYNSNGGSSTGVPAAQSVLPNTNHAIQSGTPTRDGFTFAGWTKAQNNTSGGVFSYNASISGTTGTVAVATSDITLYALWNPSISYNVNTPAGAKTTPTAPAKTTDTVPYGTAYTIPTTQTSSVAGYTFDGWATAAGGAKVTSVSNVTAATTLYARWIESNNNVIQFYDQATASTDGTMLTSQTGINWTGTVNNPTAPTKTGYTFGGWYLQKDSNGSGTGTKIDLTSSTANKYNAIWFAAKTAGVQGITDTNVTPIKLYAQWNEKTRVTVTYQPNGGSYGTAGTAATTVANILNGGSHTIPTNIDNPTKTGYNFVNWKGSDGKSYVAGDTISNLTSNFTLTAQYTGAEVTFTFEKGVTTGVTALKGDPYTKTANYGSNLTADKGNDVYTRTGYSFASWSYTNASNATATTATATADGSVAVSAFKISWTGNSALGTLKGTATLTANWADLTYSIKWDGNGGTPGSTTTSNHKASDLIKGPTATSAIPTRDGYTLVGWNTAKDGSGKTILKGSDAGNGTAVSALWDLSTVAGGATLNAYAQWKEEIVEIKFVGHTDALSGTHTADVVYNETTTVIPSSIYVGAASGKLYSSKATNATLLSPEVTLSKVAPSIVITGWQFSKWMKTNPTTGEQIRTGVTSTGVMTVPTSAKGLYEAATYYLIMAPASYDFTVEYYLQDATGSSYTLDHTETKTAHGGNVDLKAPFGYRVESGTAASQDDTSRKLVFVREAFTGFTYNSGVTGTKGIINSMSADADTNVIELYYTRNTHKVDVSFAGSVPTGVTYTPASQSGIRYGASITLNTPAAVTGYTFSGWTLKSGTMGTGSSLNIPTGVNATITMGDTDLVIQGNWTKKTYTVVFNNAAGTDGAFVGNVAGENTSHQVIKNIAYDDLITGVPAATPKNSTTHYFMGWNVYENCTGTGVSNHGGTLVGELQPNEIEGVLKVNSNMVFVARWGVLVAVTYLPGMTGAFTEKNGAMTNGAVSTAGTYYENLQAEWSLPTFAYGPNGAYTSAFQNNSTGRNLNNPKAADGYKFTGWTWTDRQGTERKAYGHYTNYQWVWESGDNLPDGPRDSVGPYSYIFTAMWEKTVQQLHFSDTCANISGLKANLAGASVTDQALKINDRYPLPLSVDATTNTAAYKFLGWTTVVPTAWTSSSKIYDNTPGKDFYMTAGTRDTALYKLNADIIADGSYGVTLYPVFQELTVKIDYAMGSYKDSQGNTISCTGMGTISRATETINAASGTALGSTATKATGHNFIGWYSDAACTNQVGTADLFTPAKGIDGVYVSATYYAKFEPMKFTVTFNIGDATKGGWTDGDTATTKTAPNQIVYNTALGSANVPGIKGKTGYGFVKWTDGNGNAYTDISNVKIVDNTVFTASWEPRDGYSIAYVTNGGTPSIPVQTTRPNGTKLAWTDDLNTVMVNDAKNQKQLGYTFGGWFAKSDCSAGSAIASGTTFADAVTTLAGMSVSADDDAVTLTLYALWTPKNYTIKYNAQMPAGATAPSIADKTGIHWPDTNLLQTGYDTLTLDGYVFKGWNTKADGKGETVTNATVFSSMYQNLYGTTADTNTTTTLYAIWTQKAFTVKWVSETGAELKKQEGLKWADSVNYYNYITAGGPTRLAGWSYTPAGGSAQTWSDPTTTLPIATLAGSADVAADATFVLTAIIEQNTKWTINFNKVNIDASGNVVMSTVNKVSSADGYVEPSTAIDITNFNSKNYITDFATPSGTPLPALKGYALDLNVAGTKTSSAASEATAGGNLVFNVYWVEKMFEIEYDLGEDAQGAKAPSTLVPPANKNASWTSADILPAAGSVPSWDGHKDNPKWQYKNASGSWVDVPAGATVSVIALTDDNTKPITLRALWETDLARLTYAVQTGGSAKSSDNKINIPANSSKFENIDAVNGTPSTMTATAASGFKFDGWYNSAGAKVSSNATFTATKTGGLYVSDTYEARFIPLGNISYVIEHYFEGLDGSYTQNTALNETRSDQEFKTINKTADMEKTVAGFTFKTGITGEKLVIASLENNDDAVLKLYYVRNVHNVNVVEAAAGADAPNPVPNAVFTPTGIDKHITTQKYGAALTIPTVTAPTGWSFIWTVTPAGGSASTYANGDAFTMPDADVTIVGTWKRVGHTVNFIDHNPADPSSKHGTVTVKAPATLPFTVDHGKTLTDPSSTGNYSSILVTEDAGWALKTWEYIDENNVTQTTTDPNSVVINIDTIFTAIWAQTFYVAYSPVSSLDGQNHGSPDFRTSQPGGEDLDLGTNVNTQPLMINGSTVAGNIAPAELGYRFVGWTWVNGGNDYYWICDDAADFNTAVLSGTRETGLNFEISSNITFHAIWEALAQNLTFMFNPADSGCNWTAHGIPGQTGLTNEQYVTHPRTDEAVNLLTSADVHRDCYNFVGWQEWVDSNSNGVIDAGELKTAVTGSITMPAKSLTYVAKWEFDSMKIYFDYANGSDGLGVLDKFSVDITNAWALTLDGATPTAVSGYIFAGWYTDANCAADTKVPTQWVKSNGQFVGSRPLDGWTPATYYAKFVATTSGYKIEHYFQQLDGNYELKETTNHADIYTGSYADVTDPANKAHDHIIDTTSGTYFGWVFTEGIPNELLRALVKGDGSTTLKLYYNVLPFDIEYNLGSTTDDDGNVINGAWVSTAGPDTAVGNTQVTIPNAELPGFKLVGWNVTYTNDDGETVNVASIGTDISAVFTMPFHDVLATAIWAEKVSVTIQYITDDGKVLEVFNEEIDPDAGVVGDPYYVTPLKVNTNRPVGYYYPYAEMPSCRLEAGADANIVKVIYRLINDYKVTFDANGGMYTDGTVSKTSTGLTMQSEPAVKAAANTPVRTAYYLNEMPQRWNSKADGTGEWLTATMTYEQIARKIFGDAFNDQTLRSTGITLYAIWTERDDFEVKYDLNNDPAINKNLLRPVPDFRNPQIIEDKTGVRWVQNGFNIADEAEFDAAPHGYRFAGWNTKADGTGLTITDATRYLDMSNAIDPNVEQNSITLYAMWEELIIKIEYITDGGGTITRVLDNVSAVSGQLIDGSAGDRLTSIATPKPGYHFVRWELYDPAVHGSLVAMAETAFNSANSWKYNDDGTIRVEDPGELGRLYSETYIARFELNDEAVVRYHANGGEGTIADLVQPYGMNNLTLSDGKAYKLSHYTLIRWNTKEDGTGEWYDLGQKNFVMPQGGLDLYAVWQINSYPVKVIERGDHVADVKGGSTKIEWGQPLPAEYIAGINVTPKLGSTFAGWHYKMVDADTGEIIEGIVQDLSELTVLGDLEIEALFDTVALPSADGTIPKTGDTDAPFVLVALLALVALAGAVILVLTFGRKSETDDGSFVELPNKKNACTVARESVATAGVRSFCGTPPGNRLFRFFHSRHHSSSQVRTLERFSVSRVLFVCAASIALAVCVAFAPTFALADSANEQKVASCGPVENSGSSSTSSATTSSSASSSSSSSATKAPSSTSTTQTSTSKPSASTSSSPTSTSTNKTSTSSAPSSTYKAAGSNDAAVRSAALAKLKAASSAQTVTASKATTANATTSTYSSGGATSTLTAAANYSLVGDSLTLENATKLSTASELTSEQVALLDGKVFYIESANTSTIGTYLTNSNNNLWAVEKGSGDSQWLIRLIDTDNNGVADVNLTGGALDTVGGGDSAGSSASTGTHAATSGSNGAGSSSSDQIIPSDGLDVSATRSRSEEELSTSSDVNIPTFTVSSAGRYLALVGGVVQLLDAYTADCAWHIAASGTEAQDNVTYAFYSAVSGLALGVAESEWNTEIVAGPTAEDAAKTEYPDMPASEEFTWSLSEVTKFDYTINYHEYDDGSGSTIDKIVNVDADPNGYWGDSNKLADELFYRSGYTFLGWFTSDGTQFTQADFDAFNAPNGEYTMDLYAHWKQDEVTISIDAGSGGTVSSTGETIGAVDGFDVTTGELSTTDVIATPDEGYHFAGWKVFVPEGYDVPDIDPDLLKKADLTAADVRIMSYSLEDNLYTPLTLTAQFAPASMHIAYLTRGGNTEGKFDLDKVVPLVYGEDQLLISAWSLEDGMKFIGWNTESDGSGLMIAVGERISDDLFNELYTYAQPNDEGEPKVSVYAIFAEGDETDIPSGDDPSGDDPSGDDPSGDDPNCDDPSGDDPNNNNPSGSGNTGTNQGTNSGDNNSDDPGEIDPKKLTSADFVFPGVQEWKDWVARGGHSADYPNNVAAAASTASSDNSGSTSTYRTASYSRPSTVSQTTTVADTAAEDVIAEAGEETSEIIENIQPSITESKNKQPVKTIATTSTIDTAASEGPDMAQVVGTVAAGVAVVVGVASVAGVAAVNAAGASSGASAAGGSASAADGKKRRFRRRSKLNLGE